MPACPRAQIYVCPVFRVLKLNLDIKQLCTRRTRIRFPSSFCLNILFTISIRSPRFQTYPPSHIPLDGMNTLSSRLTNNFVGSIIVTLGELGSNSTARKSSPSCRKKLEHLKLSLSKSWWWGLSQVVWRRKMYAFLQQNPSGNGINFLLFICELDHSESTC